MTLNPSTLRKVKFFRTVIFGISIPAMVGIPFLIESGFTELEFTGVDNTYYFWVCCDMFLGMNAFVWYAVAKTMVKSIKYDVENDTLRVSHFNTLFMR